MISSKEFFNNIAHKGKSNVLLWFKDPWNKPDVDMERSFTEEEKEKEILKERAEGLEEKVMNLSLDISKLKKMQESTWPKEELLQKLQDAGILDQAIDALNKGE